MKKVFVLTLIVLCLISCKKSDQPESVNSERTNNSIVEHAPVDDSKQSETGPFLKLNGEKFKIGVIRSGEYFEYYDIFETIIEGLISLGWLNDKALPQGPKRSVLTHLEAIKDLSYSNVIEFSPQWFFDFDWEESRIDAFKKSAVINSDLDLIISLGTFSTKVLVNENLIRVPVIADAISDPVASGIIKSIEDSGHELLTVRCDPHVYTRQVKLFYEAVKFKRLGLIYEDSENGRSYAAVDVVNSMAKELGFDIVTDTKVLAEPTEQELDKAQKLYLEALERVLPDVDAIYLGVCGGLEDENIPAVLKILNRYKTPSFAMEGPILVKQGILMGVSGSELDAAGLYNAKKIVDIFKGQRPGELKQLFENIPTIALNLETAKYIGYDIPFDILASSDEVYSKIEVVTPE